MVALVTKMFLYWRDVDWFGILFCFVLKLLWCQPLAKGGLKNEHVSRTDKKTKTSTEFVSIYFGLVLNTRGRESFQYLFLRSILWYFPSSWATSNWRKCSRCCCGFVTRSATSSVRPAQPLSWIWVWLITAGCRVCCRSGKLLSQCTYYSLCLFVTILQIGSRLQISQPCGALSWFGKIEINAPINIIINK